MGGATEVRVLREEHIPQVLRLTALENWGYNEADVRRLIHLEPGGCFVAIAEDRVAGLVVTATYGPLAWLGAVIVKPELRGRGLGTELINRALAYLEGKSVETVRLNSYLSVIPFYVRLGFRKEFEIIRFQGKPRGVGRGKATVVKAADLEALGKFDESLFGVPRGRLLQLLHSEFPKTFLISKVGDTPRGYIVGHLSEGHCEVGPWVAHPRTPIVAADLLRALVSKAKAKRYGLTVPTQNPAAVAIAKAFGFGETLVTMRMYRGKYLQGEDVKGIFALAGLEKG